MNESRTGPFDKLRPFDRLRMIGPFDKLRANGVEGEALPSRIPLPHHLPFGLSLSKALHAPFGLSLSKAFHAPFGLSLSKAFHAPFGLSLSKARRRSA